ncbi:FHA domain containing protein [Anaeromyxobacter dehalogenans 2CP-1]|uniref:FHA domain containing protein n=1 Tax=Anaeromyxobacter dehalogenans (strain ATCC BAA-258 / DSM 21875 / 2CP-1) TaxID=455488 RepID=B8JH41_ANAD2|nr:FHA domain-containing protein [Anaeromyxobacter dehalogenans]ACL64743.1 FHA domain containing protein [Anaeromyxobacter dehalogenans 2CP-1]
MTCEGCGAALDATMDRCPACGRELEFGRLTGILGVVCRACDAYNEPGARACSACGKPLGAGEPPPTGGPNPPAPAPVAPAPRARTAAPAPAPAAPAPARASAPPAPAPPAPGSPLVHALGRAGAAATRFIPASAIRAALRPDPRPAAAPPPPSPAVPPLAPGRVELVPEPSPGPARAPFRLARPTTVAGRSEGALRLADDPSIGDRHATFLFRDGALLVRDEGAPGGVLVRLRGHPASLRPGDPFAVGGRLLRYAGPLPPPPLPAADGTRRIGSPRPPPPAVAVEELLEGGVPGRTWVRSGPSITVGRAGAAVSLGDDPSIAPAHAELRIEADGTARLRDLGSATGTFARVPPHGERELREGDAVRLGRTVLRVSAVADP